MNKTKAIYSNFLNKTSLALLFNKSIISNSLFKNTQSTIKTNNLFCIQSQQLSSFSKNNNFNITTMEKTFKQESNYSVSNISSLIDKQNQISKSNSSLLSYSSFIAKNFSENTKTSNNKEDIESNDSLFKYNTVEKDIPYNKEIKSQYNDSGFDEVINEDVNSSSTKVYFFGNEDISLPTLQLLFKAKIQNDYDILKKANSNLIDDEEKLIINSLEVVSTPWGSGNKTQAAFHSFVKITDIPMIEYNDDNWDVLIESLKNSNKRILLKEEVEIVKVKVEEKVDISNDDENDNSKNFIERKILKRSYRKQSLLGLILSFGRMIPNDVIDYFSNDNNKGIFVIHPSLLPKYRGGAPIQHALLNGEKETGVSIIKTSKNKFDAGDIVLQDVVPIEFYYRFKELSGILSIKAASIAQDFIIDYYNIMNKYDLKKREGENEINSVEKKHKQPFAKIIKDKSFVYLDFLNSDSSEILNKYKAFYGSQLVPWSKIKFGSNLKNIFFDNLFIANTEMCNKIEADNKEMPNVSIGSVYWNTKIDKNFLYIKTKDGWMISTDIKVEGYGFLKLESLVKTVFRLQKIDKQNKKTFVNIIDKETANKA